MTWLRDLKPNDPVVIYFRYYDEKYQRYYNFAKVKRVTKHQIVLDCRTKFSRHTGIRIGDTEDSYTVYSITRASKAQIRQHERDVLKGEVVRRLCGDYGDSVDLDGLSTRTLKTILKELA